MASFCPAGRGHGLAVLVLRSVYQAHHQQQLRLVLRILDVPVRGAACARTTLLCVARVSWMRAQCCSSAPPRACLWRSPGAAALLHSPLPLLCPYSAIILPLLCPGPAFRPCSSYNGYRYHGSQLPGGSNTRVYKGNTVRHAAVMLPSCWRHAGVCCLTSCCRHAGIMLPHV